MGENWIQFECLIKEATIEYLVVDPHSEPLESHPRDRIIFMEIIFIELYYMEKLKKNKQKTVNTSIFIWMGLWMLLRGRNKQMLSLKLT